MRLSDHRKTGVLQLTRVWKKIKISSVTSVQNIVPVGIFIYEIKCFDGCMANTRNRRSLERESLRNRLDKKNIELSASFLNELEKSLVEKNTRLLTGIKHDYQL